MADSDVVIRVEGLGKRYSLHHEQPERYRSLRDSMARRGQAAARWLNPFTLGGQLARARRDAAAQAAGSEEEFWALKDVSFEVRRGERVGIIGRNGAGKSTLLKILSRITEPSTGRVEIRGRVASLLEVGTGFHPELTGRENIDLNGAILGMTRREIRAKFDEIVAFAEVEKFLDTPVKRYSSGMYVRLAFAVAAHLEPEILVVDEVLAVGDASFQKKCLGKMEDVADREGRTVLFVSHQMGAVKRLCSRVMLIRGGTIQIDDSPEICLETYLSSDVTLQNRSPLKERTDRQGNGSARFLDAYFHDPETEERSETLVSGRDYTASMVIECKTTGPLSGVVVSYAIVDSLGGIALLFRSTFEGKDITLLPGPNKITSTIKRLPLAISAYSVTLFCSHRDTEVLDSISDVAQFTVAHSEFYSTGSGGLATHCKVLKETAWSVSSERDGTDG